MSSFCILEIGLLTFKSIYIVGLFPPLLLLCSQHSYGREFKHFLWDNKTWTKKSQTLKLPANETFIAGEVHFH